MNSDSEGYHDTITRAYLHGIRLFLAEADASEPLHELVNQLLLSPMGRRDWPLRFWSKDVLMSAAARRAFVPPDLAATFDDFPGSRAHWDAFPRSARRGILEWIVQAKTAPTRGKRILETVTRAAVGERANQWTGPRRPEA